LGHFIPENMLKVKKNPSVTAAVKICHGDFAASSRDRDMKLKKNAYSTNPGTNSKLEAWNFQIKCVFLHYSKDVTLKILKF
jgi:hypothetical protein